MKLRNTPELTDFNPDRPLQGLAKVVKRKPKPDELGDLKQAAWLAYHALRSCTTNNPGTRFKNQTYSEPLVDNAMAELEKLGVSK